MNILDKLLYMSSSFCMLIRQQVKHRPKTLAKGKTKVVDISLRGLHKFHAGSCHKKHIQNFYIWF